MALPKGIIHLLEFDGSGGARTIEDMSDLGKEHGLLWWHVELRDPEGGQWLREESGLDPVVCDALLADETRPRYTEIGGESLLLVLRAVNMSPGSDPADTTSTRMYLEATRIITVRSQPIHAISDMRRELLEGIGPRSLADWLGQLATRIGDRMEPILDALEDDIDAVHEAEDKSDLLLRHDLSAARRTAIHLRRYMSPQRNVLGALQVASMKWLDTRGRVRLSEEANRLDRFVEDLNLLLAHASIAQDDIQSQITDEVNKRMYVLTLVATIFMPLSFLTGLLGVNVAGIPGAEFPGAFALLCLLVVSLGVGNILLLKMLKWF